MQFITGGVGYQDKDFVEYDIDVIDEEWLNAYNDGQERLSERVFERMMWNLELACAEATEKTLRAAGMESVVLVHHWWKPLSPSSIITSWFCARSWIWDKFLGVSSGSFVGLH